MRKGRKKVYVVLMLVLCLGASVFTMIPVVNVQAASESSEEMIYGADIGFLSQLEAQGVQWVDDNGNTRDALEVLRKEINALEVVPNNNGIGVFYWEPEANSTILPDGYTLGATENVGDKKLHFTDALNAFLTEPDYLNANCSYELMNINSQKAANVAGGSAANDAHVEQYEYEEWNSQKWTFEKVEGDYYKITNNNSGKVLDVKAFSTEENGEIIQNDYNEGWNQQWKIVETGTGTYKIQNRWSGLFLGVLDNSIENGAWLVQVSEQEASSEWFLLLAD